MRSRCFCVKKAISSEFGATLWIEIFRLLLYIKSIGKAILLKKGGRNV